MPADHVSNTELDPKVAGKWGGACLLGGSRHQDKSLKRNNLISPQPHKAAQEAPPGPLHRQRRVMPGKPGYMISYLSSFAEFR